MRVKKTGRFAAVAAALSQRAAQAAEETAHKRVEELISSLASTNEVTSTAALESAVEYGARAVRPLGFTMSSNDLEVSRKAKRALLGVIRHAARPGAAEELFAVEAKLIPLVGKNLLTLQTRRDLIWMLSEIGTARSVEPLAAVLQNKDLREDARCALTRLACPEAVAALKTAFSSADETFKFALAESLRFRGEKVVGYPSKKLIPTGVTTVQPLAAK
jgi:HEAT repeat protein